MNLFTSNSRVLIIYGLSFYLFQLTIGWIFAWLTLLSNHNLSNFQRAKIEPFVLAGNSRVFRGFDIHNSESLREVVSNWSSPGQNFDSTLTMLKSSNLTQNHKIFYEITGLGNDTKFQTSLLPFSILNERIADLLSSSDQLEPIHRIFIASRFNSSTFLDILQKIFIVPSHQSYVLDGTLNLDTEALERAKSFYLSAVANIEKLNEFINFCSKKNLNCIFFIAPIHPSLLDDSSIKKIIDITEKSAVGAGYEFFNWSGLVTSPQEFYDFQHLNSEGAKKLTTQLTLQIISKNGVF